MNADPAGGPVRRTDDDALERLSAIDHRLHRISTHLATTTGSLLSRLAQAHANLETLTESLGSAEPVTGPGDQALPPMTAPDRPLTPGEAPATSFMDNADRGANAANEELVTALQNQARVIQTPADRTNHPDPHIEWFSCR